jgi:hypothetical protein
VERREKYEWRREGDMCGVTCEVCGVR